MGNAYFPNIVSSNFGYRSNARKRCQEMEMISETLANEEESLIEMIAVVPEGITKIKTGMAVTEAATEVEEIEETVTEATEIMTVIVVVVVTAEVATEIAMIAAVTAADVTEEEIATEAMTTIVVTDTDKNIKEAEDIVAQWTPVATRDKEDHINSNQISKMTYF